MRKSCSIPRYPRPPLIHNMDHFPSLSHQALAYPSPVTFPWQPLGADECRGGRVPDLHEPEQAFLVARCSHVFFIASPSKPTQLAAQVDIATSGSSQALFERIPLEMLEPARGEAPDIHNGLDPILSEKGYELIQGSCAGADAMDPLPTWGFPLRTHDEFPPTLPEKLEFLLHAVLTAQLPDPLPKP